MKTRFSIATFIFLSMAGVGCGGLEVRSVWTSQQMTIDGAAAEWPDSAWTEKEGVRFGIMNDENNIYVVLETPKQNLRRQIMIRGLTVWFDPLAREKQSIGIHYPIGGLGAGGRRMGEGDPRAGMTSALAEFEYISPLEQIPLRVSIVAGQGVEVRVNNSQESLVYELKVPLQASSGHPYSIESRPGAKISVGIEISGFERGGPSADAGAPTGGRGRRGSTGADPRAGATTSMEPVSVWAAVHLAPAAR